MHIGSNLINARQSTLLVLVVFIAIPVAGVMTFIEWYEKNNPNEVEYKSILSGYSDKSAFNLCLKKIEGNKYDEILRGSHEANHDSEVSRYFAEEECKKKFGIFKRLEIENTSFNSYLLKNLDEILIVSIIIALAIYIIIFTYIMYAKCNHLGWKRLSISGSIISGFVIALFVYDEVSYRITDDIHIVLLGATAGYISTMFVVLGGRQVVEWIREGFNSSQ